MKKKKKKDQITLHFSQKTNCQKREKICQKKNHQPQQPKWE
jgi:hypothetical protein